MASRNPDRWLWLGLAVLGYYAAMTVHKQLAAIRQDSEITRHDRPPDMLSQKTENALKLETLSQLTQSANPDIRAASIKIITERLFQGSGSTWGMMLEDLMGPNTERRDKALMTLRFVGQSSQDHAFAQVLFHHPFTWNALISCLCDLLPEAQIAESNFSYRSQAERDSLWLLNYLLPYHTTTAIKANVIGRWLVKYPFGGEGLTLTERKTFMRAVVKGECFYEDSDFNYSMQSVLDRFLRIDEFRKQLEKHGLVDAADDSDEDPGIPRQSIGRAVQGSQMTWERVPEGATRTSNGWTTGTVEYPDDSDPEENWPRGFIPESAIRTSQGYTVRANTRGREQSPEEQALRRRRREAMVLGENGRPIQRRDIFEPNNMNLDGEVMDYGSEPLMEETTGVETRTDRSWWGLIRRIRPDGLVSLDA